MPSTRRLGVEGFAREVQHTFRTILVPVDGSAHSDRAVHVAITLAQRFDSTILLCHVIPHISLYNFFRGVEASQLDDNESVYVDDEAFSRYLRAARDEASTLLSKCAQRVKDEHVDVATLLRDGHIVRQLLQVARERAVDLIVLGAKGTSNVERLLIGSVSEKVTRAAPCPVLIVK